MKRRVRITTPYPSICVVAKQMKLGMKRVRELQMLLRTSSKSVK